MKRRRFLFGSSAALTGTGLLVGSRGTTTAETQRKMQIQVEGDEDAYLGMEIPETFEFGCKETFNIPLRNQTNDPLSRVDGSANLSGGGIQLLDYQFPDSLGLGEQKPLTVTFSCGDNTQAVGEFGFDIRAESEGGHTLINAQRNSEVNLECSCIDRQRIVLVGFAPKSDTNPSELNPSVEPNWHDDDGEVVGIKWKTDVAVEEVVLHGGAEWYRYRTGSSTSGTATMDQKSADGYANERDFEGIRGQKVQFAGDRNWRCKTSPCDGKAGWVIRNSRGSFGGGKKTPAQCGNVSTDTTSE
ncbi:hypothetical protein ACFQJ7_05400 [Halovenus rubra]|uniref:Uncharacterized protein n=2 Tax=Halovenus rubra TaxID=869890 RepID=A0ABD5X2X5_9EURY|nr:hypothetical protein [Halovenus rubra]